MKNLFITLALITVTFNAKALTLVQPQFEVVHMDLNPELYSFSNKVVQFTLKGNKATLSIINDICRPATPGGISCLAMPYPVLEASYKMRLVNVDGCGVKTLVSAPVTSPNNFNHNLVEKSMLVIKDNSQSVCEVVYTALYEVTLKVKRQNLETKNSATYESFLSFNPIYTTQIAE
jgi:hypothetical protein